MIFDFRSTVWEVWCECNVSESPVYLHSNDTFFNPALFLLSRLEERNIQVLYTSKLKRKNQLLASRSNKLKRFGDHVPDLLGSIAEAYAMGRFLKRPVGPIGDFLVPCFVTLLGYALVGFFANFEVIFYGFLKCFIAPKSAQPQIQ